MDDKLHDDCDDLGDGLPSLPGSSELVTSITPSLVDPADPLNWTPLRKNLVLGLVCTDYFLFTFITTVTVPSFARLEEKYSATYSQINYSVAIPALALAISPLFWTPLAQSYGRRSIMICGTLLALLASVGSACAKSYGTYMLARFLQGWGAGPASTVGLQMIEDMFPESTRGQKIGLWTASIDLGLLFGPLIGGFAALVSTDFPAWLTSILYAALLLLMLPFLHETAYPRCRETHSSGKRLPWLNCWVTDSHGLVSTPLWSTLLRVIRLSFVPNVSLPIVWFCWTWYWWVMCVITMIPAAYPSYTTDIQGLFFIGMIVGTLIAELFASGALSDRLVNRLSHNDPARRTPEMRLWLFIPAALTTTIGVVLFGISVQYNLHWAVGQVATALFGFGIQVGNTTVSVYTVECRSKEESAMDIIAFYSFHLNLSAFASPFFVVTMVDAWGWAWTFGAQGLIVVVCAAVCAPFLLMYGGEMRRRRRATVGLERRDADDIMGGS